MIGILLLTHENFGAAMLKSAELIMGRQEQCLAIGLNRGDDMGSFCEKVKEAIQCLDNGKGVLVFADLFGASPYNATAITSTAVENHFRCVTGFGLPMVLEALNMRGSCQLDELAIRCMEAGWSGVKELFEEIKKT